MSIQQMLLGASGASGYLMDKSLRFRASASANLDKTPAAGNRKTWTWSGWVKRGALGGTATFFAGSDGSASSDAIYFSSDSLAYFQAAVGAVRVSTAVYRDPSAWYHIVAVSDSSNATAQNRFRFYVNGVEVTAWSTNATITQNRDGFINANTLQRIGCNTGLTQFFDGYLADVNFIDGQALTPSSFGETNALTGVWQPKAYTGTYGTNGFYLDFETTTSVSALGTDKSGNGNNWTVNNVSLTAGVTYDSMADVPTLTSATAANFAVLNPIDNATPSLTDANLKMTSGGSWGSRRSTIGFTSGKYYCEVTIGNTAAIMLGIISDSSFAGTTYIGATAQGYGYLNDGQKYNNLGNAAYGASFTTGDVIGIAFDADARTLTFYKNNTSQGVAYSSIPAGVFYLAASANTTGFFNINFGQRPFAYTPPTGFVALNTFNIPEGTITTSGTFAGNASADGPSINLNGVPTAMTINGNAVTFGTHADKVADGFKLRTTSSSYNTVGSNTYSVSTTGAKFKYANAQSNP